MSWFSERRREVDPFSSDDDPSVFDVEREGEGDVRWAVVARFAHVAEAGYFADELTHRLDAPVRVRAEPSFDGMHHFWRTRFVLLAPEALRDEAARALDELSAPTGAGDETPSGEAEEQDRDVDEPVGARRRPARGDWGDRRAFAPDEPFEDERFELEETGGGVHWVPIVLTLTAGSAVFFGFRWWHDRPRDDAPRLPAHGGSADLWDTLSRSPSPWRQTLPDGRGQRTVRFTRQRDAAIVEEDADGDGRPERTTVLRLRSDD